LTDRKPVVPGWYMMIAVLGGFVGILLIGEAPRRPLALLAERET